MDKATGKAFLVDGKEVYSEVTFTPEKADGEVTLSFTFDGSVITKDKEIVVFETLYREGTEIAVHADIEDEGQTVTIHPQPEPEKPQTGDNSNLAIYFEASMNGDLIPDYDGEQYFEKEQTYEES